MFYCFLCSSMPFTPHSFTLQPFFFFLKYSPHGSLSYTLTYLGLEVLMSEQPSTLEGPSGPPSPVPIFKSQGIQEPKKKHPFGHPLLVLFWTTFQRFQTLEPPAQVANVRGRLSIYVSGPHGTLATALWTSSLLVASIYNISVIHFKFRCVRERESETMKNMLSNNSMFWDEGLFGGRGS